MSTQPPPGGDGPEADLDLAGFSKPETVTVTGPAEEGSLGRRKRRVSEGPAQPEAPAPRSADQPPDDN
jgi:hypothetical protein